MPPATIDLGCALCLPDSGQCDSYIRMTTRGEAIARIATSDPDPHIPLSDESVRSISALDILEHVHDEQTWLAEFARILQPNGDLLLRVPRQNPVAWIDALNIYRYVSDTIGLGTKLKETMPLGWHRHYTARDLRDVLELAGFATISTRGEGMPLSEIPHLAGLLVGNIMLQRSNAEAMLFGMRSRLNRGSRLRLPAPVAACLSVHAKRIRQGFDPDPDLDESDRPEESAATPLE